MATLITRDQDQQRTAQWVHASQNGDREAFGKLFAQFERMVFAVAFRRLGNYEEAEELCQDVFLQAFTKIWQLRRPECFGGWLRSITHRLAINRLVRQVPMTATEPDALEAHCVEDATPLTVALRDERESQVRRGLARLGEMDRDTLTAFYVKGHSLLEMSDEFAAPVGTIKRRLHVARKRLAREVEPMAV
jgi:RNA polymerase sigma-70 factor (ECF subfamily)